MCTHHKKHTEINFIFFLTISKELRDLGPCRLIIRNTRDHCTVMEVLVGRDFQLSYCQKKEAFSLLK